MPSLRFLLQQLEPFVVHTALAPGQDIWPERVELLCTQKTLTSDRLYLGEVQPGRPPGDIEMMPGTVLLLSGAETSHLPATLPQGGSIVFLSCSLAELYNTVAGILACTADWQREYQTLADEGGGLHGIVDLTAQLAGGGVLLLDQGGRVVASAGLKDGTYLAGQVSATGALPLRTVEAIFPPPQPGGRGAYAVPHTDLIIYGRHVGTSMGMLLVEGRCSATGLDMQTLCDCATDCLRRRLLSLDLDRLGSSTKSFQQCWEDIVERRLTGSAEIRSALSQMPHPVEQFIRVVVITFPNSGAGVPYNYLLARLREFFPNTNMAVYRKDVVMLLTYQERSFRTDLDKSERLIGLLARYDGLASIGNGTRNLDGLSSIFQLCKRTTLLAQCLRADKQTRIFSHEDYSMYCVIDLCVQHYTDVKGNLDVLYLIHPAVVHLSRYDLEHNNNLRDVLYYYLLNDRNLVKTAAATYMHRNTVLNKVNKILELIQLDLEDGTLRQRLMFSCQFIRYYEKVMQREFRP